MKAWLSTIVEAYYNSEDHKINDLQKNIRPSPDISFIGVHSHAKPTLWLILQNNTVIGFVLNVSVSKVQLYPRTISTLY